tara:strand:+ start:88127 stop:89374 length:1248 start_codon:yes stop_codon:yes gene_type:complete
VILRSNASLLAFSVLILSPTAGWAKTSEWPEYRGPHGNGHAEATSLPTSIDESVVKWRTKIPGKGWSSPVVSGDQIWMTTANEEGTKLSVVCVNRQTGKIIHNKVALRNNKPEYCHPMNSYATPTPVIKNGRVYAHFGTYVTACFDAATAKVLWQRDDLHCDHHRGPASSPILYDGKLFVAFDGYDVQYVVALDQETGETVWKQDRNIDYGTDNGDRMKAYCTGHIIEVDGKKQLVYPSASATVSYDPANGEPLWTVQHEGMNAAARPLFHDGLVFITNGSGGMIAVRADGHGDVTGTHIQWSTNKAVAKKSSQLIVDGMLYMLSDDGIVSCRDAKTGDIFWQKRKLGDSAASPVYAAGHIYFFSIDGEILTIKPGDEYNEVAKTTLGDGFMASPAIVDDTMILRSKSELFCIAK